MNKWPKLFVLSLIFLLSFNVKLDALAVLKEEDLQKQMEQQATSLKQLNSKRVYSIVYDDSGSMSSENKTDWSRANYAFQILAAFLDDGDEVYVTRLSAPDTAVPLEYFNYDRQVSIDNFRNTYREGGTPLEAIQTAINKLTEVEDTDTMVKHWVLIITDGGFKYNGSFITNTETFKAYLDQFMNVQLANGTEVNCAYLAINDEALQLYQDVGNNLYTFDCKSEHIVDSMMDVATLITDKFHIKEDYVRVVNDYEVELDLPMEAFDLTFLSQNESNKLVSCHRINSETGEEEEELKIDVNVSVRYPIAEGKVTDESLLGCVAGVSGKEEEVLPKGTYRFTFNNPIGDSRIDLYSTLALELRLTCMNQEEEKIEDMNKALDTDIVDVSAELYVYETEKLADLSILEEELNYTVSYHVNGNLIDYSSDESMQLYGLDLEALFTSIEARVTVGDYFYISTVMLGTPIKTYTYNLKARTEGGAITKSSLLGNRKQGIVFEIYDGERQVTSKEELVNVDLKFHLVDPIPFIHTYSEVRDDGTIIVYPEFARNEELGKYLNWLSTWLINKDGFQIRGYVESSYGEVSEAVGDIKLLEDTAKVKVVHISLPLIAICIILSYILKVRFSIGSEIQWLCLVKDENRYFSGLHRWVKVPLAEHLYIPTSFWSFVPILHNRKKVEEITFLPSGTFWKKTDRIWVKRDKLPPGSAMIDLEMAGVSIHNGVILTDKAEGIQKLPEMDRIELFHKQGIIVQKENSAVIYAYIKNNKNKRQILKRNRGTS